MSSEVPEVQSGEEVVAQQAVVAAGTPKKGSEASAASTFVSNANDLKEKAPEVYNAMVDSLARKMCDDLRRHAERMKKIMREGQQRRD
ncbi:MAG: hypothetical protein Q8K75_06820 [Chlamydiales bacterium]|nr:hypothetical protein [Chlamydiales bacterium]